FHMQPSFQPAPEQSEVQQRENRSADQTNMPGLRQKPDRAARGQRSTHQCQVESGKRAQRQLGRHAQDSSNDQQPVHPVAHGTPPQEWSRKLVAAEDNITGSPDSMTVV